MIFSEIIKELNFRFSRSGGKGGQHVNKVATKAELIFTIVSSKGLTETEKSLLYKKLQNKINKQGEILITSTETRSQSRNKEECISKLKTLLEIALTRQKPRKKTRVPRKVKLKIRRSKEHQSKKKELRKKPDKSF